MDATHIGLIMTESTTYGTTVQGKSITGYPTKSAAYAQAINIAYEQHAVSVVASGDKYYISDAEFATIELAKMGCASLESITDSTNMTSVTLSFKAAVDNFTVANQTLSKVQAAINTVSSQRSALGALQNRLEHTIANLDTSSENTSAAESQIRDVDMASEMVEYSKNNILAQAGQSMLAQANQSTQGVLSLLQ